jgi:YidC/Oxa1 family membrane protein insertase
MSDILITDWSGIAPEYAFTTKKPVIFINTPMKIMNPDWQQIDISPMDIWLRDELGISVEKNEIRKIDDIIRELLENKTTYKEKITALMNKTLCNLGKSAKVGGDYIIERINEIRQSKKSAETANENYEFN